MADSPRPALSDRLVARLATPPVALSGRLDAVGGGRLLARVPDATIGQCYVVARRDQEPLLASVVGFDGDSAVLLPFSDVEGVQPGASLVVTEIGSRAPDVERVLGRVIDPLGRALDDGAAFAAEGPPLRCPPPSPLRRRPVDRQVETGLRVVDGLLPLGEGQRVGLFAGSGVGKSTLLAQLARGTRADVCVVALVGERGREVGEFLEEALDADTRRRTTIVVATSDAPPLLRVRAAEAATALAEEWRQRGRHCLLLVDSLTRYARALREAALIAGEPPARRGYPASVFAQLPRLLERAGQGERAAITAIYTVLVEGGDMEEPVADEVRGIVDGHWVLTRDLAEKGHFPALDVLASVSRVARRVAARDTLDHAQALRGLLATLARQRDAIELGIYKYGTRPDVDAAIDLEAEIMAFLKQRPEELVALRDTRTALARIAAGATI